MKRAHVAAASAALAWIVALRLRPPILCDDAAIALRYADRLATGRGWTYNDHELIFGASSPLWVALLALGRVLGLSPEVGALALGVLTLGLIAALGALLAARLAPAPLAALVGVALALDGALRVQVLSGLEVGLALSLALGALLAADAGRARTTGLLLGLALLTKVDGLLVAAPALALLAHRRRAPPWSALAVAALVALPWFLWATLQWGSPLPRSLLVKLGHPGDPGRLWALDSLWGSRHLIYLAAPLLVLPRKPLAAAVAAWGALHLTAVSLIDLGDSYPWYLAAVIPPLVLLGITSLRRPSRPRALLALVALWPALLAGYHGGMGLLAGPVERADQAFDSDRRAAGRYLADHAAPDAVVRSPHGWVARASGLTIDDPSGLNSAAPLRADYLVLHGEPADSGVAPLPPAGWRPVARFDSAQRRFGWSWFVVYERERAE